MREPVRVCFVCLGNICRSPTAEAVFARDVRSASLDEAFEIDSAGTGRWHVGERAHPETRRTAERHGLQITHRARTFERADFERFDWVLAMDLENWRALRALARSESELEKLHLFRSFDPDAPSAAEVPDPYLSGGFEGVFEICERASAGLLAHIRAVRAL